MSNDKKTLIFNGSNLVTKANSFVEAAYKLGVTEQKVLLCIASNIRPTDKDFQTYTFSINDFRKLIKSKAKSIYNDIDEITQRLMSKPFIILNEKGHPTRINWLSKATYNSNEGTVTVRFDPDLKPYFLALSEKFTKYKLENVIHLKSSHSIRMFELLKSYEGLTERTFTLVELREKLGIEDKYPSWINFKQKVLDRAQKELEEKTDISFTYTPIKQGRPVVKVKFKIKSNLLIKAIENESITDQLDKIVENPDVIELHNACIQSGFNATRNNLNDWLLQYEKADILSAIRLVGTRKNIKHFVPYISKILLEQSKENDEKIELEPKEQLIQELISDFTPKQKVKRLDPITESYLRFEAVVKFSEKLTLEESVSLWEERKEELLLAINENRNRALISNTKK
ncbi:replication initiation protein [Priestia aryabhattai]